MKVNFSMRETFFINQQQTKGMKLTANPALGFFHVWVGSSGAKLVRVMKLTTIIILAACLQSSANGLAQNTVTFSGKDVNLESVFTAIKKQTNYRFFFNTSIIQNASKITIEVKNAPIEQVLNLALKDQSLTFAIKGRTIFVMKKVEEEKSSQVAPLQGDPVTVNGRILDENGAPAQGVNVSVRGTNKGTTTNLKGEFELRDVNEGAVILISSVGYDRQEVIVKNKSFISAQLRVAVGNLDELQVIAYGTISKRFNTGNVATVKASDIERQPVNNPLLALQGRVAGLIITQSNGVAGSAVAVRIQGRNNLNTTYTGSDPLIIIDGVPYPSQNLGTFQSGSAGGSKILGGIGGMSGSPGSTLSLLNPSDIESVTVLKDADATAIYGSRAANGAILITTKRGKEGETKIDINFQNGWGKVAHKWDMLNSQQYLEMRNEAKRNDNAAILATDYDLNGFWDTTRYTDWQKELIGGTAIFQRASITASGGSSNMSYLIGGTYSRESTVFPGNFDDKKAATHFNINSTSSNKRLRIQLTGNYMVDNNEIPGIDFTRFIALAPVAPPLHNGDGTLNWAPDANGNSTWTNPLSYNYNVFENKSNNLIGNAIISYFPLSNLEVKASLGYNQLYSNQFLASMDASFAPEKRGTLNRNSTFAKNNIQSWIVEPQVGYKKDFNQFGKLDALIGLSFQEQTSDGVWTTAFGQSSDQLLKNLAAATSYSQSTVNSIYRYNAVFGRLGYIFKDRYLLNVSYRRDGSSRFGQNNLFYNFGAIGMGWIFSEENFVKKHIPFLSFGKIKGSYGTTGNDQIADYQFMSLYKSTTNTIPYQTIKGLQTSTLSNQDLQWEETRKLQAGLDIGFVYDRFLLSVNYFRNRTNNTLTSVNLPMITGFTSFIDNYPALIQNTGWEIVLTTKNLRSKSFSWATSFNLTLPKNKLISFPGLENSSSASDVVVGQPLSISKTYSFYGIDPQSGLAVYRDAKGNITGSPSSLTDRISIMNSSEQFFGGLQNTINYKGVQLDIFIQFTKQQGNNFFLVGIPGAFQGFTNVSLGNQPLAVLDRWKKPGDIASNARFTTSSTPPLPGDRAFKDASYTRIKNVSLSYQFPQAFTKRIKIRDFKVFAHVQNLLTITSFQGLDPESLSINNLPPLRVITIGGQLSL
jgi:TonB-linked SusC/RagA family outer membrane protein